MYCTPEHDYGRPCLSTIHLSTNVRSSDKITTELQPKCSQSKVLMTFGTASSALKFRLDTDDLIISGYFLVSRNMPSPSRYLINRRSRCINKGFHFIELVVFLERPRVGDCSARCQWLARRHNLFDCYLDFLVIYGILRPG